LALARVSGPGAGAAIITLAAQGESKARAMAIGLLAERAEQSALPALLQDAAQSDRTVSRAACAALGKIGTDKELGGLVELVLAGKTPGADEALQAVASRAQDKSAAAQKLVAMTQNAQPEQLSSIFDVLAMLGGSDALNAVVKAASSSNEQVSDPAIRALANWPEFDATRPLLTIAANPATKRVHNVLTVQALARLVQNSDKQPAPDRLQAAEGAMKAATRDEDKKLLLTSIASVPSAKAAETLKPFLSDPQFKKEAGLAGISLAQALLKPDARSARSLAQAIKDANVSPELNRKADNILKPKK
jgi:hypothetical protein